ncbi:DUF1499 domain-containing protein [Sneathiella marina]|uniref:DUF1499 domain-containing protein n=1 Tax=Sneathiella marina TaxID=2950108 RepID=A0ABY4W242_9PROT|nr:DUF1499 domain-containing protein [Sneathiella marina]USG60929.1 DUF1499 domain-containing protein [Sneathiella marina]
MFRKILKPLIAIFGIALVGLAILRFTPLWENVLPAGDTTKTDFATVTPADSPNWFLVCPPDYCLKSKPSLVAPDFPFSPKKLHAALQSLIKEQSDIKILSETSTTFELVVRTKWVGWPDHVSIQILPASVSGSTLAIYSRSNYGRSDFDVNRDRIEGWLLRLTEMN